MSFPIIFRVLVFVLGLSLFWPCTGLSAPQVVVSIRPIHSLVAGVMEGIASPTLLLKTAHSPHHYQFKPSDVRLLSTADIVFWVGEDFEIFLIRPLKIFSRKVSAVSLEQTPGLTILPIRQNVFWKTRSPEETPTHETHETDETHEAHEAVEESEIHSEHEHENHDLHIWLDTHNTQAIVKFIADVLVRHDPENTCAYLRNRDRLLERLRTLDTQTRLLLTPLQDSAYIVFHDAFQYFEKQYDLKAIGAVTSAHGVGLSAARVTKIRRTLQQHEVKCLFYQPPLSPLVDRIIEGTSVSKGKLDPLGIDLEPGINLYFDMIENMSHSLVRCLGEE